MTDLARKGLGFLVAVCLLLTTGVTCADTIEDAGDVLQVALPLGAYVTTYALDDADGRGEFVASFLTTMGTTYGLKYSIDRERPDGGSHSFPSGHTAAAFGGASFIQMRYGWKYGLPAYAVSSFVGWSRVHADRHYPSDVLAGAAIAVASSSYFVHRFERLPAVGLYADGETTVVSLSCRW